MTSQSPGTDERSLGDLVAALTEQSARLVRAEIDLAKAELSGKAKELGIGGGMFAAAAFLAVYGLGALIATAILVLAIWLPAWAAALVVTSAIFATAVVLVLVGKKKMDSGGAPVPQAALDGIREDLDAVKESLRP
ncbi:MAG: phage holin family protein [Micrococcales bacterium]|nr:phage holin family protein [Micrococcales bacterium]